MRTARSASVDMIVCEFSIQDARPEKQTRPGQTLWPARNLAFSSIVVRQWPESNSSNILGHCLASSSIGYLGGAHGLGFNFPSARPERPALLLFAVFSGPTLSFFHSHKSSTSEQSNYLDFSSFS